MHHEILSQRYENLNEQSKLVLLSQILHELTVRARSNYWGVEEGATTIRFEAMIGYNELYHRIAGQLIQLVASPESYHGSVFIDALFEVAYRHRIDKSLEYSLNRSFSLIEKAVSPIERT